MNGNEIRERIDINKIRINMALTKFILTDEVNKLMQENEELRKQCPHHFVNGVCEYCDMVEEDLGD